MYTRPIIRYAQIVITIKMMMIHPGLNDLPTAWGDGVVCEGFGFGLTVEGLTVVDAAAIVQFPIEIEPLDPSDP